MACERRGREDSKQLRTGAAQRRLRLIASALAIALLAYSTGCDSRVRAIRAELSDEERQRFDRGQQVSAPCWSCHDFYGENNKIGPYLSGIFGRGAGEARYGGYSDAMKRASFIWSEYTLSRFLRDEQAFVPGTSMMASGIGSSEDIRALVFYMRLVTQPAPEG